MRDALCAPAALVRPLWVPLVVLALGCEAEDSGDPPGGQQVEADMDVTDALRPPVDGGPSDMAPPPAGEARWVAIIDATQGLAIGGAFGTDVDAVAFECPDGRSGFAAGLAPEDADATQALGAPDGPCEAVEACAVSLGANGTLLVRLDSGDLAGCTVTVHEQEDDAADRFDVWTCADASLDGCVGPWFGGGDGGAAGVIR